MHYVYHPCGIPWSEGSSAGALAHPQKRMLLVYFVIYKICICIYIYVYISYITKYSNNILRFVRMIRNNFVCFFAVRFLLFQACSSALRPMAVQVPKSRKCHINVVSVLPMFQYIVGSIYVYICIYVCMYNDLTHVFSEKSFRFWTEYIIGICHREQIWLFFEIIGISVKPFRGGRHGADSTRKQNRHYLYLR